MLWLDLAYDQSHCLMIVTFSYGAHLSANRIYYDTISHLTCVGGVRRGIKKIQTTKPKYLIIETLSWTFTNEIMEIGVERTYFTIVKLSYVI